MKKPVRKRYTKKVSVKEKLDEDFLESWSEIDITPLMVKEFPLCCGLTIISNFPNQGNIFYNKEFPIFGKLKGKNLQAEVPVSVVQEKVKTNLKKLLPFNHVVGYVITLNSLQIPYFESVVLECGFEKVVKPFHHAGHGRDIAVYFKPPPRAGKVKKSIFGL